MKNTFLSYFPKNKSQWKEFSLLALPVIGGSFLFALNSFVDNFMVGGIHGATAGLFAVNSWTSIIMGIFAGSSATGSILVAQYYYSGNHEKVREIAKIRFIITLTVSISFAIASYIIPENMVKAFLSKPDLGATQKVLDDYNAGVEQGLHYIKYIAVMWILIAITFNIGNMSREIGYAKFPFIAGIFGLSSNILLNYLTMKTTVFGYQLESEGAAIATIAARFTVLSIMMTLILVNKLPVIFKPWTIFSISKVINKQFWSRALIFLFTSSTMIFITFRNWLYVEGYPSGSIVSETNPNIKIGAADMLGISWAIFGVISVVFNGINIVVSKFVGGELGKDNIELAKENSKRVHGFMFTLALPFTILGFLVSFLMPYFTFLQNAPQTPEFNTLVLKQAGLSTIALSIYMVWWIWFVTAKSATVSGGKVNLVSIIDAVTSGPLFLGWLALCMLVIGPQAHLPFWITYIIAFLADIPRGVAFLWIYYKKDWAFNITKEHENTEVSAKA